MFPLPAPLSGPRLTWAVALAQLVSWGAIYYSFSVFLVPMETDLGWSRASLTAALALGLVTAGIAGPFVGGWIDQRGGRGVMTLGSLIAASMLAAWAWSPSYLIFCLSWVGLGLAQAMTLYEPAFAMLHKELGKKAPAAIAGVTLIGGLASTVFIPLCHWLISIAGWRASALGLAGIVLLVCVPIHLLLPRGSGSRSSIAVRPRERPLVLAARRLAFWGLLVAYAASGLVFGAMTFHVIPLLLERGLAGRTAITIVAMIGLAQVAGRLVIVMLWRDVSARALGRVISCGLPLAMLVLMWTTGVGGALLFALLYGVCNGITTILRGIAAAELLGREGFGTINGTLATPAAFTKAAAPAMVGALWTRDGHYELVLWLLFGCAVLFALAFWLASSSNCCRAAQ